MVLRDRVYNFDLFDFPLYYPLAPFISYENIGKNENT